MTKRPQIPHTKSSMFRPMTQMNGDYLTQLKKPICSELNADFKGSMRARETHCKQLVGLWFKDQQFLLRKLNKGEDEMHALFLEVHREKRRIEKESQTRRLSWVSGTTLKSHNNASALSSVPELPRIGTGRVNANEHSSTNIVHFASNGQNQNTERNNDNGVIRAAYQVTEHGKGINGRQNIHAKPSEKAHSMFLNIDQGSGVKRLVKTQNFVSTEIMPITPLPETTVQRTISPSAVADSNSQHPVKCSAYYQNAQESTDDINMPRLYREETDIFTDYGTSARSNSAGMRGFNPGRKRQSVGLILINKQANNMATLQRKKILDNEKLQMYDRNEKGEIVPAGRTFKRKSFEIPTLKEAKQREKFLIELKQKQGEEVEMMQQFLTKVDEEKGRRIESFRPRRQATKDELILKEQPSAGMVSLQRLASVFNHRNMTEPLPKDVAPGSIESMKQCSYLRTFHIGDGEGLRKSERRQNKHIFSS